MATDARILTEDEFANALCMTIAMDCEAHRKIVANQRALTECLETRGKVLHIAEEWREKYLLENLDLRKRLAAVEALVEKWRGYTYEDVGLLTPAHFCDDLAKALGRDG